MRKSYIFISCTQVQQYNSQTKQQTHLFQSISIKLASTVPIQLKHNPLKVKEKNVKKKNFQTDIFFK